MAPTNPHSILLARDLLNPEKSGISRGQGLRIVWMRRNTNRRLRQLACRPSYPEDSQWEGDDAWSEWVEECARADMARAVLDARHGRDLDYFPAGYAHPEA